MITVYVFHSTHPVKVKPEVASKKKNQDKGKAWVDNNPLVSFSYPEHGTGPETQRLVKLIAADNKYFFGLDVYDKNRPKKFCRNRATKFSLWSFNSGALVPKNNHK
jgi:hypothetical protein